MTDRSINVEERQEKYARSHLVRMPHRAGKKMTVEMIVRVCPDGSSQLHDSDPGLAVYHQRSPVQVLT